MAEEVLVGALYFVLRALYFVLCTLYFVLSTDAFRDIKII